VPPDNAQREPVGTVGGRGEAAERGERGLHARDPECLITLIPFT
jgi:hypothetical protein